MLFSNLHSHHTGEGRGFYPSCYLFHACAFLFVFMWLKGSLVLVFCGFVVGRDSYCWCCLCLAYLEAVSCCFMGCVGKGHSWTSSVRVSSHGERKEKRVECMGLYLPPLACMVVKLRLKGLASLWIVASKGLIENNPERVMLRFSWWPRKGHVKQGDGFSHEKIHLSPWWILSWIYV